MIVDIVKDLKELTVGELSLSIKMVSMSMNFKKMYTGLRK